MKISEKLLKQVIESSENDLEVSSKLLYLLSVYFGLNSSQVIITDEQIKEISHLVSKKGVDLFDEGFQKAKLEPLREEFIEEYRNVFDNLFPGSRGSLSAVKKKLKRFFKENQINEQELLDAAKYAVRTKGKYAGQADYFLYKRNKDGSESTRALDIIEELNKQTNFIKVI